MWDLDHPASCWQRFRWWWSDQDKALILIAAGLFAMIVGLVVAMCNATSERSSLMSDCMADGRKEYECVGILDGKSVQPASVIVTGHQ